MLFGAPLELVVELRSPQNPAFPSISSAKLAKLLLYHIFNVFRIVLFVPVPWTFLRLTQECTYHRNHYKKWLFYVFHGDTDRGQDSEGR